MKDLKNLLTSGKNSKNIQSGKGKSFGYQILGFGSGVAGGSVPVDVDYLVVSGGGAGGRNYAGGGGAGGYRTSFPGGTKITLDGGDNNITVGAGGAQRPATSQPGVPGTDSVLGSITSSGGGGGGGGDNQYLGVPSAVITSGGSGGGAGAANPAYSSVVGIGNTPPVSPPQGNTGGVASNAPYYTGGGGGGAGAVGTAASGTSAGAGGVGSPNSITGSAVFYSGGGGGSGGGSPDGQPFSPGAGGNGGGGAGGADSTTIGTAGTANTGGGGGGGSQIGTSAGAGAGGSGTIIVRIPAATAPNNLAVAPGTNTLGTNAPTGDKIATFTVTGTLTV